MTSATVTGLEPATYGLEVHRATFAPHGHVEHVPETWEFAF